MGCIAYTNVITNTYGWYICQVYSIFIANTFCFVHMQEYAEPQIAGAGHQCYDRSFLYMYIYFLLIYFWDVVRWRSVSLHIILLKTIVMVKTNLPSRSQCIKVNFWTHKAIQKRSHYFCPVLTNLTGSYNIFEIVKLPRNNFSCESKFYYPWTANDIISWELRTILPIVRELWTGLFFFCEPRTGPPPPPNPPHVRMYSSDTMFRFLLHFRESCCIHKHVTILSSSCQCWGIRFYRCMPCYHIQW